MASQTPGADLDAAIAALKSRVTANEAGVSQLQADRSIMATQLDELEVRVTALEQGSVEPPPPPPPPSSHFGLAPNEAKWVGPLVSDLRNFLNTPNQLTQGTGWPAAHLNAWCGIGFDKTTKDAYIFGGGHNDGGSNALMRHNALTETLEVLKQATELSFSLPDGSTAVCPRPLDFGPNEGPDSRHTYDGTLFRQKDKKFYVIGGFPYTCQNAISGRIVDIQRFDPAYPENGWEVVRPDCRDDWGRVSLGGSSSYSADELSNGDIAIIAKGYVHAYDPDTDTFRDAGGPGNRQDIGAYNQVVPIGNDEFFCYDYHRNYRIVRYIWKEAEQRWGIAIGQVLGKLPMGYGYVTSAAFCNGWVVGWSGNNSMYFYNPDLNIMRVRQAPFELRPSSVSCKMTASSMQHYADDVIIAYSRWQDQAMAYRMPEDVMNVTRDPDAPPTPLQPLIDAAQPGETIFLQPLEYEGAVIDKPDIILQGPPEGCTIRGFALDPRATQIRASLNVQADNLSLDRVFISAGRYSANDSACIRLVGNATGLRMTNGSITNSHNGILTSKDKLGPVYLENVVFDNCGLGDRSHPFYYSVTGLGENHLVLDSENSMVTIINCDFLNVRDEAHAIKSGALSTEVRGGSIIIGDQGGSRALDIFAGGSMLLDGLNITQIRPQANSDIIGFGREAWQRKHAVHNVDMRNLVISSQGAGTLLSYPNWLANVSLPDEITIGAQNVITGVTNLLNPTG